MRCKNLREGGFNLGWPQGGGESPLALKQGKFGLIDISVEIEPGRVARMVAMLQALCQDQVLKNRPELIIRSCRGPVRLTIGKNRANSSKCCRICR